MASKPRVTNRMPQFIDATQRRAARGVLQAVILGSQEAAPLTPRESSNLLNSQYREVGMQGARVVGSAGYTAEYALHVHEANGRLKGLPRASGKGVYWGPSGEPQFLRIGFKRAEPKIIDALKDALKV